MQREKLTMMPPFHRRTNNGRQINSLCAVLMATVAILALIIGGFRSIVASSVPKESSIVDAIFDSRGDYIISSDEKKYILIKFEVSGKVQGVSFRRHTKDKAEELGLMGWCRNTQQGTVEGEYEYVVSREQSSSLLSEEETQQGESVAFQHWLCNVGSPRSHINGCTFSDQVVSTSRRFDDFRVNK